MNKIKKEFLGKRVFGSPESAMRILSMWLIKKEESNTSEYKYAGRPCELTKITRTTHTIA